MSAAVTHPSALRPGAALGTYPERPPVEPSALERLVARLWRRGAAAHSRRSLRHFVRAVERAECAIDEDKTQSLPQHAQALREAFARDGLSEALIARSFALVRRASTEQIGLQHYPCQLMAGRVMLDGALAEMQTGEGKTLAATLPACTAALAGIPVHVVTANDYLVTRDAAAMGPVFRALGLRVGAITEASTPPQRAAAYARDVTYITSQQLAFDYLRDRMTRGQRHGAVRTQLEALGDHAAPTPTLLMRGLCFAIVDEADSVLIDEARTPFIIAGERDTDGLGEQCERALEVAATLRAEADFSLDEARRCAHLSEVARDRLATTELPLPTHRRLRLALIEQALTALHLYHADRDYLVREHKVQIIDPLSGRVMADRSWSGGLQQMMEVKEACPVTAPRDTLARMSFQRFFRRYLRLSGMTGTAREVAGELLTTYGLNVVEIPPHRPSRRCRLPVRTFANAELRWAAVVERVREMHAQGRPVLIGTRSVEDSEHLSRCLADARLEHEILNARQDAQEARIVAAAGQSGRITVATNMAGRGTDITLDAAVDANGGLHVIAVEFNDATRLDRQLAGRCGRHGERGTTEVFLSADDQLLRQAMGRRWRRRLGAICGTRPGALMLKSFCRIAQAQCERRHRKDRHLLAIMQDRSDRALSFSGQPE